MQRPEPTSAPLYDQLLRALDGAPRPTRTALVYRVALVLQAVFVVLLPLAYVALVGLCAYGVYWWGVNASSVIPDVQDKGDVLGRYAPLVIGSILVFFLLKPLLAPRGQRHEPNTLRPEDEPLLFDFVAKLAHAVGAPMPSRIDVDLQVNASASFARGLRSFAGGDLALTVGLPLVAGMDARQLTAVLAHEFGHFAQGAGMRSYYLTATIQNWLYRVAFERDAWDERLERASHSGWAGTLVLVLWFARGGVWISRKLLFVLARLGDLSASWLSRQMEFDADKNAVRIVGEEAFSSSMHQLPLIEEANAWALRALNEGCHEGRLPAEFPALIEAGLHHLGAEERARLIEQGLSQRVHMYASHPPMGKRIEAARAVQGAGTFEVEVPSTRFFRDFAALSRRLSERMYRDSLGEDFQRMQIIAAEELRGETEQRDAKRDAWERVFGGLIPEPDLATHVTAQAVPLQDAREVLRSAASSYTNTCAEAKALDERIGALRSRSMCAEAALRLADDKIKPGAEPLLEWKKGGAETARDEACAALEDARREHAAGTLKVLGRRFAAVRALLAAPERDPQGSATFERHLQDLLELEATSTGVRAVQDTLMRLHAAWPSWNASTREKAVAKQIEAGRADLLSAMRRVEVAATALRGESVHGAQDKPFREHLLTPIDPEASFGDAYDQCDRMLSLWYERNYWNWCELAALADEVERELVDQSAGAPMTTPAAEQATTEAA